MEPDHKYPELKYPAHTCPYCSSAREKLESKPKSAGFTVHYSCGTTLAVERAGPAFKHSWDIQCEASASGRSMKSRP